MTDVTDPLTTAAAPPERTLLLSTLMHRTAVDAAGQALGRLSDIIVRLREEASPRSPAWSPMSALARSMSPPARSWSGTTGGSS